MLWILRAFILFAVLTPLPSLAEDAPPAFRSTPYPLPRFVSLASDEIYVRSGPGQRYPIKWIYKKKGLPVEVVLEYETWRKIRDYEGAEGWVHHSLLSGRRTGLIMAKEDEKVALRRRSREDGRLLAWLGPGVPVSLERCEFIWCEVRVKGYQGWIERKSIWGVYENENFD